MVNGKLMLRVHRIEGAPQVEAGENRHIAGIYYTVRVTVGNIMQQTKSHGKGQESSIEQDLTYEMQGADGREDVVLEILSDQKDQVIAKEQIATLGDFINGVKGKGYTMGSKNLTVYLTSKWLVEKHSKFEHQPHQHQ